MSFSLALYTLYQNNAVNQNNPVSFQLLISNQFFQNLFLLLTELRSIYPFTFRSSQNSKKLLFISLFKHTFDCAQLSFGRVTYIVSLNSITKLKLIKFFTIFKTLKD
ncbi:hypothetical protein DLE54_10240 [Psychrobacter sp. YP14]|nr:hypothetical protein DLE54_10240 [Psychrobacter sp. YP14]